MQYILLQIVASLFILKLLSKGAYMSQKWTQQRFDISVSYSPCHTGLSFLSNFLHNFFLPNFFVQLFFPGRVLGCVYVDGGAAAPETH